MKEHWGFFKDQNQSWRWIKTDSDGITLGSSETYFESVEECITHAMQRGYQVTCNVFYIPDAYAQNINIAE